MCRTAKDIHVLHSTCATLLKILSRKLRYWSVGIGQMNAAQLCTIVMYVMLICINILDKYCTEHGISWVLLYPFIVFSNVVVLSILFPPF